MENKETQILDTVYLSKIENPKQAKEYIQYLFNNFTKWKPLFFDIIDNDIKAIIHNQKIRLSNINEFDKYFVFAQNINIGLENIKDALISLMKNYNSDLNSKEEMFEYLKAEFESRLEASFDEKIFIENELQKFTDFETRANELQKEIYKNDSVLDEYQSQYENKYGVHYSEFEYLRMISGYYHYPEREKKKTFYFTSTLVKQKLFKQYVQECYKKYDSNPENGLTGFACNLHPDTVKEIFDLMVASNQISDNLTDFQAIFSNTQTQVKNPVKWLIKQGDKANNRAFHTFLRLMLLDVWNSKLEIGKLKIANKLFTCNGKPIFPNDKITYPSNDETKNNWFESSRIKHFRKISDIIKKTRPQ